MKCAVKFCALCGMFLAAFLMWLKLERSLPMQDAFQKPSQDREEREASQVMVHIKRQDESTIQLPLEVYLVGVVGSEMSADFEMEALKAQAVAARTFAAQRNFTVDDTTASQVFQDEEQLKTVWKENYTEYHDRIEQAVMETKGEILTYEGEAITAAFFSSCNGYTNNSEDYWKNATPYLRSVASPWDQSIEGTTQAVSFTPWEFAQALGFQNIVSSLSSIERYENGYVKSVTMDGITFSGREIREALSLRSSAFEITMEQDRIMITTHGFGHGIGMSQYGANAMAKEGKSYEEILKHYYTGVEISTL